MASVNRRVKSSIPVTRGTLPGANPQAYAVYVDERDQVWVSDFGGNAVFRFEPGSETFERFGFPRDYGLVYSHSVPLPWAARAPRVLTRWGSLLTTLRLTGIPSRSGTCAGSR